MKYSNRPTEVMAEGVAECDRVEVGLDHGGIMLNINNLYL